MSRRAEKKVWLRESEIRTMESHAYREKDLVLLKLGAWVGLRSSEIVNVQVSDIHEEVISDKSTYWLGIYGKKTDQDAGEGKKKYRDAYIPEETYLEMRKLINAEGLGEDDYLIYNEQTQGKITTAAVRDCVYKIGRRCHEETGKDKYLEVSPHDLRRFFASYNLNEERRNPRVVMQIGGWKNLDSLQPYWGKPSKDAIHREMSSE